MCQKFAKLMCKTVTILLLSFSSYAISATPKATFEEADVKAAFVFYFFHFISWPESESEANEVPIEFCAIKDNPVISALKLIMASPKAVNTSVNLTMISDPAEVVECDYVFIDSASKESAPAIIAGAHGRAILTVSDIDGFAGMGGMIELKRNLNRVKVLIGVDALNAQGLRASSKLLSLATIISSSQEPEEL